jgi:FkbM family methyltransferase
VSAQRLTRLRQRLYAVTRAQSTPAPVAALARASWLSLEIATDAPRAAAVPRSIARFWWWQVARRARRRDLAISLMPYEIPFVVPTWSQLGGSVIANGSHDPSMTNFLARTLRPGDRMQDVGANIGLYSVIAAHAGAAVTAYEPGERARSALERNRLASGLSERIAVSATALSDYDGEASFTTDRDVSNHLVASGESNAASSIVPVARLDSLLEDSGPAAPSGMSLLKVDAEGHDLAVLRGASAYLDAVRPVVIVESWAKGLKLRAFLADFGYRLYRYEDRESRLVEHGTEESGQADLLGLVDQHLPELAARLGARAAPAAARPRIVGWV